MIERRAWLASQFTRTRQIDKTDQRSSRGDCRMKKKWSWFSTLFLAPAFLSYTIFIIIPVLYSSYYSLTKWNGGGEPIFSGFDNYARLLADDAYWKVVS